MVKWVLTEKEFDNCAWLGKAYKDDDIAGSLEKVNLMMKAIAEQLSGEEMSTSMLEAPEAQDSNHLGQLLKKSRGTPEQESTISEAPTNEKTQSEASTKQKRTDFDTKIRGFKDIARETEGRSRRQNSRSCLEGRYQLNEMNILTIDLGEYYNGTEEMIPGPLVFF